MVLSRRRDDADLPPSVAPGSAESGLFLPYRPPHHPLLAEPARRRGAADGLCVTTTGVGLPIGDAQPSAAGRVGDVVLLSGPIGAHGTAILGTREGLGFEAESESDGRPLDGLVAAVVRAVGRDLHVPRDPTRGGLTGALDELAEASRVAVEIVADDVPVPRPVAAACEPLDLDPPHVADEGCLVAFVPPGGADAAPRSVAAGTRACVIGRVTDGPAGRVTARTGIGSTRIVDVLVGEQLPRIC